MINTPARGGAKPMTGDAPSALPLTSTAFHILITLTSGPFHGYAIKREVEERTAGVVRLGAGTLYHALKSLNSRGLVAETDPPDAEAAATSRWRFHRITPEGRRVLVAECRRLEGDLRYARAKLAAAEAEGSS